MSDQKYSAPHALYLSFFSQSFYQDVVNKWKGLGFAYLAALLALCTIPAVLKVQADLSSFMHDEASLYIKQLPKITISKGSLSITEPQPYIIKDEKTGDPFMIIDTTGNVSSLEGSKAMVLLTKTDLVIKRGASESRSFNLSDFSEDTISIDRSSASDFIDSFLESFPVIFYPFALLFSFIFNSFRALLYSVIGLIVARIFMVKPDYKTILRLSMVSLTPSLLPGAILIIAGLNVPFWWFISFIIPVGYIVHAIRTNFQT
jgi:hypothetical protein